MPESQWYLSYRLLQVLYLIQGDLVHQFGKGHQYRFYLPPNPTCAEYRQCQGLGFDDRKRSKASRLQSITFVEGISFRGFNRYVTATNYATIV